MKKLLLVFLIIAGTITTQAQDSKPTKEQTINYLKNILLNAKGASWDNSNETKCGMRVISIIFSVCSLTVEYDNWCSNDKENVRRIGIYTIDISNIEKVDGEGFKPEIIRLIAKDHALLIQHKFTNVDASGKETVNTKTFSEADIPCPLEKEKVIEAFNHLRKLCGAPEPIKF